ncbi:MAG: NADH-quinone oxidoreductase subunit C [Bacteroidota bacterium]|nr:NADH-quinone oxidoreductase subunit C [Bacteroidota bacterium]
MYKKIKNNGIIPIAEIPVLEYPAFADEVSHLLDSSACHCVNYYAVPFNNRLQYFCFIANDETNDICILSHQTENSPEVKLESLAKKHFALHIFEREIHENFGIQFDGHPWLKPVRYPFNRADKNQVPDNYPFYRIESEELHEVGVGPIHAGVIEPGHFRFICDGEKVLHLEIHLGYQHRGVEQLFIKKNSTLQRCILAESIAGDSVIGHSMAYAGLMESLSGKQANDRLSIERVVAMELERIAIHIGDTSALSTDVAYQFGQVVNEALRTLVINTTQLWCGNRFGKGLIRPFGTHYPIDAMLADKMLATLKDVGERYLQITDRIYNLTSVLDRFETVGEITRKQAEKIGAVGMAARTTGLKRDIRHSHPFAGYHHIAYEPVLLTTGDVLARGFLRKLEVEQSLDLVNKLLERIKLIDIPSEKPIFDLKLQPSQLGISLTEGWRGEICHSAVTNEQGEIIHYKVKDPSMHNWMALALAVRNQEISDFPICNKSFNLSYCGHDL